MIDGIEYVDLLAMAEADGAALHKVARAELAGPCPKCGGDDRFHILLESKQGRPMWFCRNCHPDVSDAADYVRIIRGRTDWADVFADLRAAGMPDNGRGAARAAAPTTFTPKPRPVVVAGVRITDDDDELDAMFTPPAEAWQEQVDVLLWGERGVFHLLRDESDAGAAVARDYLRRRHLTPATVHRFALGFLPAATTTGPMRWRAATCGAIVMPWFFDGQYWQVKYRAVNVKKDDGQRFNQKSGAGVKALAPFNGDAIAGARCVLVVEGEFDAMLGAQLAPSDVAVVTWGSAGTSPNVWALGLLANRRVVVAMDHDGPGAAAAEKWRELGALVQVPAGKDIGDFADVSGVDAVRAWITEVTR